MGRMTVDKVSESGSSKRRFALCLDGVNLKGCECEYRGNDSYASVVCNDVNDFKSICDVSFFDLCQVVREFVVFGYAEKNDVWGVPVSYTTFFIDIVENGEGSNIELCVSPSIDLECWRGAYSVNEFSSQLKLTVEEELPDAKFSEDRLDNFYDPKFYATVNDVSGRIGEFIDSFLDDVSEVARKAGRDILERTEDASIIQYFSFPEETKVVCEQYLMYFIQFLRDIGINASAEMKEEVSRTLFKVTPNDGVEALQTVKEALAVYLALPSNSEAEDVFIVKGDIAAIQLHANIQHLNTQNMMMRAIIDQKNSEIENKNATIQMKDIAIGLLQERALQIAKSELEAPLSLPAPNSDREELFGGVITLGEAEKVGVKVNIAKLYRSLKRKY